MEQSKKLLTWMVLLTIAALGVMLFAYVQGVPILAVMVSFSTLVINYNLRSSIITDARV